MNSLVGIAAPSDLVGSFLVKILHSVEGGNVEQGCSNLSPIFAIAHLSLTCVSYLARLLFIHITCLIFPCA